MLNVCLDVLAEMEAEARERAEAAAVAAVEAGDASVVLEAGAAGAEGVVPGGKKARARSRGRRTPLASTAVCASRAACIGGWIRWEGRSVNLG